MGTDLFKQGIDREDDSLASTAPVVTDPTGSLSLSRTVTSVDTGPKVPSIPDPDPELLALFAPQADGDFDTDGLGDTPRRPRRDRNGSADDDWQNLLDDSIPVRSLAKKASPLSPAMTAELRVIDPPRKRRWSKRKRKNGSNGSGGRSKKGRLGMLPDALARPTADRRGTAPFARSVDALKSAGDGPARTGSIPRVDTSEEDGPLPAVTGAVPTIDPLADQTPSTDRASDDPAPEPVSQLAALAKPASDKPADAEPSGVETADELTAIEDTAVKGTVEEHTAVKGPVEDTPGEGASEDAGGGTAAGELALAKPAADSGPSGPAASAPGSRPLVKLDVDRSPATADATSSPTTAAGGESSILAATARPDAVERPGDTDVRPLATVRSGVRDARLRRGVILGVASVACLALIAAVLVSGESDDGGTETAADTEELAAQSETAVDADEPTPTSVTTTADPGDDDRDRTTLDRRAEIAAAGRAQQPSSTVDSTDPGQTSTVGTDTTGAATDGTGGATDLDGEGGDTTEAPDSSTTTTDATDTSSSTPTSSTGSTTCSGVTWNPVVDDGFDGSTLDTSIWSIAGGSAGQGVQQPDAVSVADGALTITAQMDGDTLVSGGVQHLGSQQYGRYEVVVRTEIDPDGVMGGTIQTVGADGSHTVYSSAGVSTPDALHTMVVEWTPTAVKYFVDGSLVRTEEGAVPEEAQTLSIRYDASGPTLAGTVTMQIDHVKIWEYGGGC